MGQAENVHTSTTAAPRLAVAKPQASRGYWLSAWHRLYRDRVSMVALFVLTVIVLITLAAPLITDRVLHQNPYRTRVTQKYRPPALTT